MITAFVLYAVATSGVKGFALMLLVGTLLSMVTAVAATRALLGLLAGFRWFNNPAFMGATAQKIPAWQRIDFVARQALVRALRRRHRDRDRVADLPGLNLGIDFGGGSQITFETPQATSVEEVRQEAADVGRADAIIQGRGEIQNGGYRQFTLKTESLAGAQSNLQDALRTQLDATSIGVKNVSASFSEQILRGAILAIIVSLALIVIYVSLRFEFKFSLPVLVALLHDILITLGLYSLTGREMTAATVAAILTILGYSIYDTIIIFDRVRENIPLMRRSSFAAIANQSLWETIRRSLATSFITLLPIASLLLVRRRHAQRLRLRAARRHHSGAYSTIFIAAPLLVILKEREPEYAKRKEAGLREKIDAVEEPAPVEAGARGSSAGGGGGRARRGPEPTAGGRRRRCRDGRSTARGAPQAPAHEASWPSAVVSQPSRCAISRKRASWQASAPSC